MSNCLVTKLKSVVNDDTLTQLGLLCFVANRDINKEILYNKENSLVKWEGDVIFWEYSSSGVTTTQISGEEAKQVELKGVTCSAGTKFYFDKYKAKEVTVSGMDINQKLDKYTALETFTPNGNYNFTLDQVYGGNITTINVASALNPNGIGKVSDLMNIPTLKSVSCIFLNTKYFPGELSSLAKHPNLYLYYDAGNARYMRNWNSIDLRPYDLPIISIPKNENGWFWASSTSCKNFIINMSYCKVPEDENVIKVISFTGISETDMSSTEVTEAIGRLNEKGYTVTMLKQ